MPSYAAIAPIAQHRGREPQLAGNLDQRPTAARQQSDRLRLELIRKMTPFLTHSTPSRSPRSLPKVSTNSGEAHVGLAADGGQRCKGQHNEHLVRLIVHGSPLLRKPSPCGAPSSTVLRGTRDAPEARVFWCREAAYNADTLHIVLSETRIELLGRAG